MVSLEPATPAPVCPWSDCAESTSGECKRLDTGVCSDARRGGQCTRGATHCDSRKSLYYECVCAYELREKSYCIAVSTELTREMRTSVQSLEQQKWLFFILTLSSDSLHNNDRYSHGNIVACQNPPCKGRVADSNRITMRSFSRSLSDERGGVKPKSKSKQTEKTRCAPRL